MEDRIREIYSRYNDELKPLVAEQELRMSAFEEPLLLNLSKMFDFLSQALSSDKEEQRREILQKMDNILTLAQTVCTQIFVQGASFSEPS